MSPIMTAMSPSQMLRVSFAMGRDWHSTVYLVSDAEMLALWRSALPHAEHVHAALPPAGARIVALSRREASGRQSAFVLRCALENAPGLSRLRAAYLLMNVQIGLLTTPPERGVAQYVGFDVFGSPPMVLEQLPVSRWRMGSPPA